MPCAVRTTCPYCGVGCGVSATPGPDRAVAIAGDANHGSNAGRLCSKGTHLGETVRLDGRLLHPMIGDERATWDDALDLVARAFADTIAAHGPESVAIYGSGQLLTEDYYAFNKLMKGYIGAANIDTNSRLCMASAVAAHIRAFGEDAVPAAYDDLDEADLIVLVGSNTAWCHPVIWQRIEAARAARGTKLVVIDPRRTETAELADLHLPVRAGGDVALFTGLLAHLHAAGLTDLDYLRDHVEAPDGFFAALPDPAATAEATGIAPDLIDRFFALFAAHPRTLTLFSMGVNQATDGTDKANAIINVHLATGRIGKPGAAPFSLTGQPNAMGGREVGGLANTLAAHMDFAPANVDRVARFWGTSRVAATPGLKAVDLFRAIADGRVKALWIAGTNPAVSMPDAGAVRAALAACPFVVVSEVIGGSDTARFAHVRLPAAAWGEKDGTVTSSERRISRQRPFLPLPGEAMQDWRIVAGVARRMGFGDAFAWGKAADVFREHAALTAFENDGARALNLSRWATIDDAGYEALADARWGGDRLFGDGRFSTPSGRARLVAITARPAAAAGALNLNTGRYRDQWHTMTRTGLSAKLSQHRREPLVEINPADAAAAGIADGDLARVTTAQGTAAYRASVTPAQRPGDLFVPMHWTDMTASGGRTGLLANPAVDPVSGQPGFKRNPAAIERIATEWRGFLLLRDDIPARPDCLWATRITVPGGVLYELAGDGDAGFLDACLPHGQHVEANDSARGTRRIGVLADGRLAAALFLTRTGKLPQRDWLIAQLAEAAADRAILAGRAPGAQVDCGAIVCACFDVGVRTIIRAIADQSLADVGAIGKALGAGTNCGSCRPALAKLIAENQITETLDAAE
ncbi:MAG: molybdopterin-dependent oxidoreductase [Sphingomonas sp.]